MLRQKIKIKVNVLYANFNTLMLRALIYFFPRKCFPFFYYSCYFLLFSLSRNEFGWKFLFPIIKRTTRFEKEEAKSLTVKMLWQLDAISKCIDKNHQKICLQKTERKRRTEKTLNFFFLLLILLCKLWGQEFFCVVRGESVRKEEIWRENEKNEMVKKWFISLWRAVTRNPLILSLR